MSTEKDREIANKWAQVVWDESDLPEEEKSLPETIALSKACGAMGYSAGIQHARQGERGRLIKFITWVRNHYAVNALIDNKGMVDFYLGQEESK